jgi:tetratricopeptide (TPR) repeat protein
MRKLPEKNVILQWAFRIIGLLFIFGHDFVVNCLLRPGYWSQLLFPDDQRMYYRFMGYSYVSLILSGLLCLFTAWGLKRNWKLARWTGIAACSVLILGFPWLTVAGAIGLYVLIATPPTFVKARPAGKHTDYWSSKKNSLLQTVLLGVGGIFQFYGLASIGTYAVKLGMPDWNPHELWIVSLLVFNFVYVAIHEMGHAAMAWALHERIREIAVGPLIFSRVNNRNRIRFDWKRILSSGGHMASIPLARNSPRLNRILVIAAGPFASLLTGVAMLVVFFALPGTAYAAYWWVPGWLSVVSLSSGVLNLIPVGYSDGSMLLHTICWTRAGKQLIRHTLLAAADEEGSLANDRADFQGLVDLFQSVLEEARQHGEESTVISALCHHRLGAAHVNLQDWTAAQSDFNEVLKFEAECERIPGHTLGARLYLHQSYVARHQTSLAACAYAPALEALNNRKKTAGGAVRANACGLLSSLYRRVGKYHQALEEAAESLRIRTSKGSDDLVRPSSYLLVANAQFALGRTEDGRSNAQQGARLIRAHIAAGRRPNFAWLVLGDFGEDLWKLGQTELAREFLQEGIEHLEAAGAVPAATLLRTTLANLLRAAGSYDQAWQALPAEEGLSPNNLRRLLEEKVRLLLDTNRADEAVAAGQELLAQWQAVPAAHGIETAAAESLIAEAYLAAGDPDKADSLAQRAADLLTPMQHPEAAAALVTLAIIRHDSAPIVEGRQLIEEHPYLSSAEKTRHLERAARRLGLETGELAGIVKTGELVGVAC